jgi:hypothetical protein
VIPTPGWRFCRRRFIRIIIGRATAGHQLAAK